ncbi:MAG: hypothetical protein KBT48_11825 [Firmicutes bacterium]|nr:hypothetical protein [Bacillota bacterium]
MKYYFGALMLSGISINCGFQHPECLNCCKDFLTKRNIQAKSVCAKEFEKQAFLNSFPGEEWNPEAENKAMINLVSDAFLPHNRMILHCVSFIYKENAYLITAPSGTGKSTQFKNLKELYGEEIQIINGDNTILHFQEEGIIQAQPTPWKGKEGYGSMLEAPVKGIIWLKQAKFNKLTRLKPSEAVYVILHEIKTYSRTPDLVHKMLKLEETLLNTVPVYQFENTGTLESSELLMQTIRKELCNEI